MNKQWCETYVDYFTKKLNNYTFHTNWFKAEPEDKQKEPEVFIWWEKSNEIHCRLHLGDEEPTKGYAFISLGIQGAGCLQMHVEPTFKGMDTAFYHIESFRKIVEAIKSSCKSK